MRVTSLALSLLLENAIFFFLSSIEETQQAHHYKSSERC
jgi:hypothetical protein